MQMYMAFSRLLTLVQMKSLKTVSHLLHTHSMKGQFKVDIQIHKALFIQNAVLFKLYI